MAEGGIIVEVWKEYDVANEEDLAAAVDESEGRPFRIYGRDRSCYFDLDCKDNVMFAYQMVLSDKTKPHFLGILVRILMTYMNNRNMTADHAPVCESAEGTMKPFREKMYAMFPNVKRVQ